jgi:hypothetical protein
VSPTQAVYTVEERKVTGRVTLQNLLDWGVTKETIQEIIGGTSRISFTGDKISRNQNLDTGPNAGMAGFLAAFRAG